MSGKTKHRILRTILIIGTIGLLTLPLIFCSCVRAPQRTQTTAALSGSLQRQAQAADAAQVATREVAAHLERMELSRVDGKAEVLREWLRGQR